MSAYFVGFEHITALLSIASRRSNRPVMVPARVVLSAAPSMAGAGTCTEWIYNPSQEIMTGLGLMLARENAASVAARYPGDVAMQPNQQELAMWRFKADYFAACNLSTYDALNMLACFEYQSCEHPEWPMSDAAAWCEWMRKALIDELPGMKDTVWNYTGAADYKARAARLAAGETY